MMTDRPHVFLDLDGALSESGEGIMASIAHALAELGRPVPPPEVLRTYVGPSLWEMLAAEGVSKPDQDRGVAIYRAHYTGGAMYQTRLYEGVEAMLTRFAEAGFVMCLATAKPMDYAAKITAHLGLTRFLDAEFGSNMDGTRTDKAEILAHALAETGADPARSMMLGDRRYDVAGALANGITPVGALWGYGSRAEFEAAGCKLIASDPAEAADMIMERLA